MGTDSNCVNLTLRADAECQVTCDGDFLVLLNPNQIVKEKAPTGQHILQFISISNPDILVEKIVDFPDAGKNYLVLVNELTTLMKESNVNTDLAQSQPVSESVPFDPVQTKIDEDRRTFEYYDSLVDQGDRSALIKLANCYYKGVGVEKSAYDAILLFERVLNESEVENEWREAFDSIKDLAEQGNSQAQYALGDIYYGESYGNLIENDIIQEDKDLAIDWYKKSASNGFEYAMITIGNHYYYNEYDAEEAEVWYKRAIKESNETIGMSELLELYDCEGRADEAIELCEKYGYSLDSLKFIDIQ
jgi:TPR repeat protein